MRVIKHAIMIFLVVIILFPMVWIVATSVRRDNAAFSTKMFSNRYTFQYFKDLLLNRKNIPQQISELKKIANLSTDYVKMSKEELLASFNKSEAELKQQMALSKEQIIKSEQYVEEVVAFAKARTGEMVSRFNALKDEEKMFFETQLTDILASSKSLQFELTNELIHSFEKVEGEEQSRYLALIEKSSPDFVKVFIETEQEFKNVANRIQDAYQGWFETVKNNVSEGLQAELETVQSTFLSLLTPQEFSYSKWNREINLKGYKGLTTELQSELTSEQLEQWTQLIESFQEIAKETDNLLKTYSTKKEEIIQGLENQMKERNDVMALYLSLEEQRLQASNNLVRLENQIESEQQKLMGFEERMGLLNQQIQGAQYEMQELRSLVAVEINQDNEYKEITSDNKTVEEVLSALQHLSETIQELGDIPVADLELLSLKESMDWFVGKKEQLLMNASDDSVKNALDLLKSNINPIREDLADLTLLVEQYNEIRLRVDEYTQSLNDQRVLLNDKQAEIELISSEYNSIVLERRNIEKVKGIIRIITLLEQTDDYEALSAYNGAISSFINNFSTMDHPAKALLSEISAFDKLVYLDRNYAVETSYLKETVDEIEKVLTQFDAKKESYINLIHANVMVKTSELDAIETLQKTAYNRFSSELNRIARIASDLSEMEAYQEIADSLERIDKNIFESLQYWIKKPEQQFMRWLINTIIIAIATSAITVMFCALGAYPFSRLRFKGRKYGLLFLLLIQMFPIVMGMVALYLLLRFIGQYLPGFGLDSLWGLGLIYLGNIAFNMWLLKGYFDTIPNSLEEAAMIDGSTRFQTFWKIVLPLTAPMLAVVFLIVFMGNFNEFVLASVVLQSPENYTFAVGLQSFSYGPYQMEWGLFTAAALIGAIPMVILSLSLQRYLVSGLTSGSVKG
ncbi:MAG TPA: ABC transporter permease subunit [Thermotogota bacterium]|nr:ABC transporter permease subunit [Thermotogota bacterium]